MATRYNIVNGPSKFDLVLALFDGNIHHRRPVTFSIDCRVEGLTVFSPSLRLLADQDGSDVRQIEDKQVVKNGGAFRIHPVTVNVIGRADCFAEESWNFEGKLGEEGTYQKIRGHFSTASRVGWIECLPKPSLISVEP